MVQGAVDSSDRITRLKLNTIKSRRRCGPTIEEDCRGIYRSGNAQTAVDSVMWPSPNNDYDKIKYKTKFNSNHFEVNYPQVSALLFLNDNYKGGQFIISDVLYKPEQGSAIIFPSNFMFPHEVKTIKKGTRYSIVTWLM